VDLPATVSLSSGAVTFMKSSYSGKFLEIYILYFSGIRNHDWTSTTRRGAQSEGQNITTKKMYKPLEERVKDQILGDDSKELKLNSIEIKCRLILENFCYHSVREILSSNVLYNLHT
jgi:hypothetical protein